MELDVTLGRHERTAHLKHSTFVLPEHNTVLTIVCLYRWCTLLDNTNSFLYDFFRSLRHIGGDILWFSKWHLNRDRKQEATNLMNSINTNSTSKRHSGHVAAELNVNCKIFIMCQRKLSCCWWHKQSASHLSVRHILVRAGNDDSTGKRICKLFVKGHTFGNEIIKNSHKDTYKNNWVLRIVYTATCRFADN